MKYHAKISILRSLSLLFTYNIENPDDSEK